jgi:hypothetical protein
LDTPNAREDQVRHTAGALYIGRNAGYMARVLVFEAIRHQSHTVPVPSDFSHGRVWLGGCLQFRDDEMIARVGGGADRKPLAL